MRFPSWLTWLLELVACSGPTSSALAWVDTSIPVELVDARVLVFDPVPDSHWCP